MLEHHIYADNATDHSPGSHPRIQCDGREIWRTYGTWKGHVGPGVVFMTWGAWWTVWVLWSYVRLGASRFKVQPWYGPAVRGRRLPLEPVIKFVGPLIITFIELYGDHDEFRTLTCPDGRFAMTHMNNWQHASVYPGFFLAGALDWVGMVVVPLPQGLQQLVLSGAFFIEGFLMANHKKHEELDQAVHSLLVLAIYGCSACLALEMWRPRSVLAAAGRGFFAILQGAWLIQIARIMWGDDPRWSLDYPGSAMMPPVYFVWMAVAIAACICACYVAMVAAQRILFKTSYSLLPQTQRDVAFSDGKAADAFEIEAPAAAEPGKAAEFCESEAAAGGSFVSLRSQGSMHMRSDSANESRPGSPRLEEAQGGRGRGFLGASPFFVTSGTAASEW